MRPQTDSLVLVSLTSFVIQLAGKLGQEYKDYQKRVPYRLVPYIW